MNTILSKEAEDSSPIDQAHQELYPQKGSRRLFLNGSNISRTLSPLEEAEDSSPMDQNTSSIIFSKEAEDSSLMNIIPMVEVNDSSSRNPSIFKKISCEEAEDSSPINPIHRKKKSPRTK